MCHRKLFGWQNGERRMKKKAAQGLQAPTLINARKISGSWQGRQCGSFA